MAVLGREEASLSDLIVPSSAKSESVEAVVGRDDASLSVSIIPTSAKPESDELSFVIVVLLSEVLYVSLLYASLIPTPSSDCCVLTPCMNK